ncbi:WD40 repeat domain-containing protein [Streptomyces sp. NPDC003635]
MRRSRRTLGATFAAALGSVLLAIPGATPAHAATGVSLPLYQLADMKVDGSHQKIFLSMPAGVDGRVVVTDYNGKSTWLGGLPGASGLALSPDNQTLYVAARDIDTIVAYDTATLAETARYHVGDGTAPLGVAVAGGKLWFGYGVSGDLGSIDVRGPEPVVELGLDSSLDFGAELVTSPADPNMLVVGTGDPNRNTLTVYDVSSGLPVMAKRRVLSGTEMNGLRDIDVTPDGRTILTAALISPGYRAFRLDDLSDVATHTAPASPLAVAAGPDGTVAGGAQNTSADIPDVSLYAPTAPAPLTAVELGAATQSPVVRGLAWAPDGSRLFAVTGESGVMGLRFHSLPVNTTVQTVLALDAPASSRKGRTLTLTGTLTPGIAPGTTVTVTRHDAANPEGVSLGAVPVAADGTFTATDAPAKAGEVRYVVAYGGDHWHAASSAEATVEITRN